MKHWYPTPDQSRGLQFLLTRRNAGLCSVPGWGKTSIFLALFEVLKLQNPGQRFLVVSTPAIIDSVWGQEIVKWGSTLSYKSTAGMAPSDRTELFANPGCDVIGVSFNTMPRCFNIAGFREFCKDAVLVIDESQFLSNHNTIGFRRLRANLHLFSRRFIASGTPMSEGLMKWWSQAFIMDMGETLLPRIGLFRDAWFHKTDQWTWAPNKKAGKQIIKRLKPLVLRFGYERLNMPEKKEIVINFTVPSETRANMRKLEREFIAWLNESSEAIIAENAAAKSQKLRQITSGLVYDEKGNVQIAHTAKLEALHKILDSLDDRPALIVYEYTSERDFLLRKLENQNLIAYNLLTRKERKNAIKQWNGGKINVMLAHAASLGHGANLQHARDSVVIWYTLTWSAEKFQQMNSRLWRKGRESPVWVYLMMDPTTIDARVLKHLREKTERQHKALSKLEFENG